MTMTRDEWELKKQTEKQVKNSLEKSRQTTFKNEQSKESIFSREISSIVDCDN